MKDMIFFEMNLKVINKMNILMPEESSDIESTKEFALTMSKNGLPVITVDGKALSSRYDPEREAENLTKEIKAGSFVVYSGIGNFYPIHSLIKKKCKIVVYIPVKKIFLFLIKNMDFTNILSYENISFSFSENGLNENIKKIYFPGRDGNFTYIESRSEKDLFPANFNNVMETINRTLEEIKSDYSVQAHFGKIWTRNIIQNLKLISGNENTIIINQNKKKGCIITAAGPGLNSQLDKIREVQNDYLILATDTTLPVLIKKNIAPDFFLSIDPQIHSLKHITYALPKKTALVADLCCNTSLVRNVLQQGIPVFFSRGNHPLAVSAEELGAEGFLKLENGTGSVTVTALSFAAFLGWKEVILLGGDFANTGFAPYCRGTYLAGIFDSESNRLKNAETEYTGILFRDEVFLCKETKTYKSKLLDKYGSFCKIFCKNKETRLIGEIQPCKTKPENKVILKSPKLPELFFKKELEKLDKKTGEDNELLPLTAWLKYKRNLENSWDEARCMTEKYIKYFI